MNKKNVFFSGLEKIIFSGLKIIIFKTVLKSTFWLILRIWKISHSVEATHLEQIKKNHWYFTPANFFLVHHTDGI